MNLLIICGVITEKEEWLSIDGTIKEHNIFVWYIKNKFVILINKRNYSNSWMRFTVHIIEYKVRWQGKYTD